MMQSKGPGIPDGVTRAGGLMHKYNAVAEPLLLCWLTPQTNPTELALRQERNY